MTTETNKPISLAERLRATVAQVPVEWQTMADLSSIAYEISNLERELADEQDEVALKQAAIVGLERELAACKKESLAIDEAMCEDIRRTALYDAAKAVCGECTKSWPMESGLDIYKGLFVHQMYEGGPPRKCPASRIHRLIAEMSQRSKIDD